MVSKTLHKKQKAIEKQYDNLVEAANRLALTVESDHNIIADSHEYIHRNTVLQAQKLQCLKRDLMIFQISWAAAPTGQGLCGFDRG